MKVDTKSNQSLQTKYKYKIRDAYNIAWKS